MSLIKLKNVSKFYYSKGVIASGFTKVNLSFNPREFVAITGESGSGKSTLLNVISGLDTYEEGEMYINGEETSHFTEKDFEDYRRKYVGNIFQNFNLVNSYTVYQNIELVLLLNGNKKKKIKKQVLEIIKKVGLYKFRNTKVSKLSGGQKQRVGIARALAKDTPIIIADEPTGNLDSKSGESIIELLSEISKDKLVIIVTHNYEQVAKYVTRKITMHDGRVLEDKKIKEIDNKDFEYIPNYQNITLLNKIRLALRNTFNIVPKFLLMLLVYLFITVSLLSEYSSFKEQEYIESKTGDNYIFNNVSDRRIIINKKDKSEFNEDDFNKIKSIDNVDYIVKEDFFLDTQVNFTDDENFWIYGSLNNLENFRGNVDFGRMPENSNEILIEGNEDNYYLSVMKESLLDKNLYLSNIFDSSLDKSKTYKIVGIKYYEADNSSYDSIIYVNDEILNSAKFAVNQIRSTTKVMFLDKYREDLTYQVRTSDRVPSGEIIISSDLNYECPNEYCINKNIKIEIENLYYKDSIDLKITNTYNKNNLKSLLGIEDYDMYNGSIFINTLDYNKLFDKGIYQSSVFVKDSKIINDTIDELNKLDLNTLAIKNTLVRGSVYEIFKIIGTIVTIVLVVVLLFISYFVIRVILKSRNKYFSTIRMLGANKKVARELLILELFIVANISFFAFILVIYLNSINVINIKFINTINEYLKLKDFIIIYFILMLMSLIISMKFSKKLFKKSAITTMVEEV